MTSCAFYGESKKLRSMLVDEIEEEARHKVDDDGKQYPYHNDRPKFSKKFTHIYFSLSDEIKIKLPVS